MGAIKDIYDILSDITAKVKSRSLKASQKDLIEANFQLVANVEKLKSRIENLERDHAQEVADLKRSHAQEIEAMAAAHAVEIKQFKAAHTKSLMASNQSRIAQARPSIFASGSERTRPKN